MANTKKQWKPEESDTVRGLARQTDNARILRIAEEQLPGRTFAAIVRHMLTLKVHHTPTAANVQRVLLRAAKEREDKNPNTWMRPRDAAKEMGMSISSLYDAVYRGVLTSKKIDSASYLKRSQVERYQRLHSRQKAKPKSNIIRLRVPASRLAPPSAEATHVHTTPTNGHTSKDPAEIMLQLWRIKSIDSATLVKLLEALA